MAFPFGRSTNEPSHEFSTDTFKQLLNPIQDILQNITPLDSRGDRPLKLDFEHHIKALIYYHLERFSSVRELIQNLKEDDFARLLIAPPCGIEKSSFAEANNNRGMQQIVELFKELYIKANKTIPKEYSDLGNLVAIDGSLIDAVLSMYWADYRTNNNKAKIHLGFDVNRSIPKKLFLDDGKSNERPFVSQILEPGDTGIMDRGYQHHANFDAWQCEGKHFVCRIKKNTTKTIIRSNEIPNDSIVFYDSVVLLGLPGDSQTKKQLRLVGYSIGGSEFWIATDRHDLTSEQIAMIYKLRWDIEKFFGWWKRHMRVYHLIARSEYGLWVQIMSGLITYLLFSIYCQEKHGEKVSIRSIRELRNKMMNESRQIDRSKEGLCSELSERRKNPPLHKN